MFFFSNSIICLERKGGRIKKKNEKKEKENKKGKKIRRRIH
jgi:hypothetical protein